MPQSARCCWLGRSLFRSRPRTAPRALFTLSEARNPGIGDSPHSLEPQHPAIGALIRTRTGKVIKAAARRLNDVPLNERSAFCSSLLAAFDATLPLQYRPAGKV